MSSHVQPVPGRTAGRGRPALATGVFLLVASLVLLVAPPAPPDARSIPSSPSSAPLLDLLVQGRGAAAAVAAAGGRSLAALPIVDGLLARVPAAQAARLDDRPGVTAVTDADRPLRVRAADPDPAPPGPDLGSAALSSTPTRPPAPPSRSRWGGSGRRTPTRTLLAVP